MADVTIAAYNGTTNNGNVQNLGRGAVMPATGGLIGSGAALTAGQTFSIDVQFDDDIVLAIQDTSGGANTITIDAGVYPTSPRAARGAATVSAVTSNVVLYVPTKGRHLQSNGTITGSFSAAGRLWAFRMPGGITGHPAMNTTNV